MVGPAMMAADTLALEGLEVEVVNCRKVKPLPDRMLEKYARLPIVTLEENAVLGGFDVLVPFSEMITTMVRVGAEIRDLGHRCGTCMSPTGIRFAAESPEHQGE